ncbi:MAG: pitrilysin family protein [bacterium]
MKKGFVLITILSILILGKSMFAQYADNIDIAYKKFVLDNGLTLIVHEDHKAPIVAVNVWYHVGSKNEKPGKTGFAHLFEHLMFNGSENCDDDYFQIMERVGTSDLNGTTNNDRTNYFETLPTSAMDLALWMESDRMGHLLGAVTQAKLDEQRGVVQNEKRQGENEPYSLAEEVIATNTYPKGHPYSWTVIGSMEDLTAASLEDVHEWFKSFYGAANAVLCVTGDVNTDEVKAKVEKYFGDIPSGPPLTKPEINMAKMVGTTRYIAQDRVPQSRLIKVWNVPQWGCPELAPLDLLSDILSSGKTSRLYKRLVYEEQIATRVSVYYDGREIGSQFYIEADIKPGVDVSKVEKVIDEELEKILKSGLDEKELKRVKTQYVANFVRGIERIGGFGGKSDILAQSMVFGGSPDHYKTYLNYINHTTIEDIKKSANQWLTDGQFILEINPFPEYAAAETGADRTKLPETGTPPDAEFPKMEKTELSNGMKVILAERNTIPVVNFNLLVDAGFAADQFGIPGAASLAMSMMDEGTKKRDALQISEELAMLGSYVGTGANLDMSSVSLSALKANLDASLDIFADVILNPSFPDNELERLRKERYVQIQREKASPTQMGLRVVPQFIYGKNHAYGLPFSGSGYEETVKKITKEDLVNYHKTWFKPNNATLVIVGDITMKEIKPRLEKLFGNWKGGDVPKKNISEVSYPEKPILYLMDKPASQSSIIFGAHAAPPYADKNNIAIESMNEILGGMFTSRINMNLREDKHWSYGSGSFIVGAKAQRPFILFGLVQTDKTKESIIEMHKEIVDLLSTKPVTDDEMNKVIQQNVLSLPGSWETANAVLGSIANIVRYDLPENYYDTYAREIKSLSLDKLNTAAVNVLYPDNLAWVVVGDKAKIEAGLKEIGYEIKYIDGDGNLIK